MEVLKEKTNNISLKGFLELYKRFPVIAVTGPAGVGKSTITKILAELLGGKIFTELPEENPFLQIIKTTNGKVDNTIWGNNQNYFLATDTAQITKGFIASKENTIIFDFALTQPLIFADMNLTGTWLQTFTNMHKHQFDSLPKPDLIIEIKSDDDEIINRLSKRQNYIDDQMINRTKKLNRYYKNGIVQDYFSIDGTQVIELDNSKNLSEIELKQMVKQFLDNFLIKVT